MGISGGEKKSTVVLALCLAVIKAYEIRPIFESIAAKLTNLVWNI
jgi:hypothetical protein